MQPDPHSSGKGSGEGPAVRSDGAVLGCCGLIEGDGDQDPELAFELLRRSWGTFVTATSSGSSVPERTTLSRQVVLSAALDVVDAEGLDAPTMRRLGQRLHPSP